MIYSGCSIFWLWRMWCLIVWRGNAALVGQEAALHHSSSVVKAAGNCISHLHQPGLQLHQDSDCVTCVITELGNTSISSIPNLCQCNDRTQSNAFKQSDCKIWVFSTVSIQMWAPWHATGSHPVHRPIALIWGIALGLHWRPRVRGQKLACPISQKPQIERKSKTKISLSLKSWSVWYMQTYLLASWSDYGCCGETSLKTLPLMCRLLYVSPLWK